MTGSPSIRAQQAAKRAADVAWSVAFLVLLSPVLGVVALAIRVTSRGEVVFRQRRIGRDGRPFLIHKFRTMTVGSDRPGVSTYVTRDDPRITPVGAILRRTSLDELPQLYNVLKGDMSIVGPRPDLPHHVDRYTNEQRRRLSVRPGITGWAQVSGRNDLTWEERIELDLEYVDGWSLLLDLLVLAKTVGVVLGGTGAALPGRTGGPS